MPSLDELLALLLAYKYWVIFPIAVVEGPMISVLTGWLVSTGALNVFVAYVLLVFADLVGDSIYYALGRFGGNPFLKHWGHWIGVDDTKLLKLEEHFGNHGNKYLLFGKTQGFGAAFLAAAGVIKFPFPRFIGINAIGTILKVPVFLLIGYFFGEAYEQIDSTLTKVGLISFGVILFILILYFFKKRRKV